MNKNHDGFVDIKSVEAHHGTGEENQIGRYESVTIRDSNDLIVDSLTIGGDGIFTGRFGKVQAKDLGEYIIRITGRPGALTALQA